jgi:hypothetical protein
MHHAHNLRVVVDREEDWVVRVDTLERNRTALRVLVER